MHVRVYCAPTDVPLGCEEVGPFRWYKKDYKYRDERIVRGAVGAPAVTQRAFGRVMMAALPALPLRGFVPR